MKLHQQLEHTLKIRINSNEEIIPAIKKLSEMGKFDKPKELAMFAIILDRLGKIEDVSMIEQQLHEEKVDLSGLDDWNSEDSQPAETPAEQGLDQEQPETVAPEVPQETPAASVDQPEQVEQPSTEQPATVETPPAQIDPIETSTEEAPIPVTDNEQLQESATEVSTDVSVIDDPLEQTSTPIEPAPTADASQPEISVTSFSPENITDPQPDPTTPETT